MKKPRLLPFPLFAACLLSFALKGQSPVRCDTIYLRDGSVRFAQNLRLTDDALRYWECPGDSLQFEVKKSSVVKVRMGNGGRLDCAEVPGAAFEAPALAGSSAKSAMAQEVQIRFPISPLAPPPGQGGVRPRPKFTTAIHLSPDGIWLKGSIRQVGDTSLVITEPGGNWLNIPAERISEIKVRRRNGKVKGFLIGGIPGAALGTVIGLSSSDIFDPNLERKAAIGGAVGLLGGALLGMGILGAKITVPINGSRLGLRIEKQRLEGYARG